VHRADILVTFMCFKLREPYGSGQASIGIACTRTEESFEVIAVDVTGSILYDT